MSRRIFLSASALAAGLLLTCGVSSQQKTYSVIVHAAYFEADGMRFESIEQLRTYLLGASHDFRGVTFIGCDAAARGDEVSRMMGEVARKRGGAAAKGPLIASARMPAGGCIVAAEAKKDGHTVGISGTDNEFIRKLEERLSQPRCLDLLMQ